YLRGNPGMLAVDPKEDRILFATATALTWFDAKTGVALARFERGGRAAIQVTEWSPDGALACVGDMAGFGLWRTASPAQRKGATYHASQLPVGTPAHSFSMLERGTVSGRFSPGGKLLATSASEREGDGVGLLELRDTRTYEVTASAKWADPVVALDFAPD